MAELERLVVRKLADTSEGTRVERFDQITGERVLVNPETNAVEPWPLAGVRIETEEPPARTQVPTSWVAKGVAEGWVLLEGEKVVHRPGGTPDNKWAPTHTFTHADAIILDTVDGQVRYKVTHQPDKYADDSEATGEKRLPGENSLSNDTPVTDDLYEAGQTRVDWFYELELDN